LRRIASARRLALDVSPLRDSVPYRAIWLGQVVSLIGTQMRYVAVPVQVFNLTGSTAAVGLIGLAELVPLVFFSIAGGALADRMDRRRLIAWTLVGSLVSSGALALVALPARPSLAAIYALTASSSAFNALERPARTAMLPALVGEHRIPAAMALRQVVFQVTNIVGPLIGGALIAAFPFSVVYGLDAITFVAALVALRWVPPAPPEASAETAVAEVGEPATSGWSSVREGLAYSFRTPLVLSIFLIDLGAMVFGMPRAVFPALAAEVFELGHGGVALLYAAPSAGALLGAITTGWVPRVRRQGRAVIVAVVLWGVFITLAGLTLFSLPLTLACLALAGAADVVSAVLRGTILVRATPDALRGRVSAANLMIVTGGPRLGDVEAGLVASLVGAPASVVVGGLACLATTALIAVGFPALRSYRTPA
jgi:MFS family permease